MSTINVLGPVGFNPTGPYDATRTYQKLDVVYYQGSSYVAISDSLGQLPTNADYWLCIAAGSLKQFVYDSVASMKADNTLADGMTAQTLGYYEINDGGAATYKITDTESETEYQEELESGLFATLISDEVCPEMFGAYGDDTHDDTNCFQNMFNKFKNIKLNGNKIYKISETLILPNNIKIVGCGIPSVIKSYINDGSPIFKNEERVSHFIIKDFYINANNKNSIGFYFLQPYDNCIIENIYFSGFYNSAIKIGSEDYISQTLLLNNNIIYVSQSETIINPMIELTRVYEANITNNKILGHEPAPIAKSCLELIACYDCSIIGNSFAHTADCGVRIKSTTDHDCKNNRIISNTYENITGDYSICLEGKSGKEVSSTLIVEANTYYNAPRLVYCDNENQGFIIGLDVTGGRRNVAFDMNSNKVLNANNNTFLTCDNKALSMSGIGLQGYDGKMRFRGVVNDSSSADYGLIFTDTRVPHGEKKYMVLMREITKQGIELKWYLQMVILQNILE